MKVILACECRYERIVYLRDYPIGVMVEVPARRGSKRLRAIRCNNVGYSFHSLMRHLYERHNDRTGITDAGRSEA
jgi:hypothetical protein